MLCVGDGGVGQGSVVSRSECRMAMSVLTFLIPHASWLGRTSATLLRAASSSAHSPGPPSSSFRFSPATGTRARVRHSGICGHSAGGSSCTGLCLCASSTSPSGGAWVGSVSSVASAGTALEPGGGGPGELPTMSSRARPAPAAVGVRGGSAAAAAATAAAAGAIVAAIGSGSDDGEQRCR